MPAIKDVYISTQFLTSQPMLIKLDNENIGGHLTPLHWSARQTRLVMVALVWTSQTLSFDGFYKAFNNLSAISLDHLSVSSRHTRASNENMSLPVHTDVEYSFFPRTITDWNSLPLAVSLLQSIQSLHGCLLSSASSNRCWSSWHSGSNNGWSAPIAGYFTEEPKSFINTGISFHIKVQPTNITCWSVSPYSRPTRCCE